MTQVILGKKWEWEILKRNTSFIKKTIKYDFDLENEAANSKDKEDTNVDKKEIMVESDSKNDKIGTEENNKKRKKM